MLPVWRDIAVFLDATTVGEHVGRHAAALARRHGAHLVGVYGLAQDSARPSDTFARGTEAIREVIARQRLADEQKVMAAARHFAELTREYEIGAEFRIVWRDDMHDEAILRALHCDLIVAAHPKPEDLPAGWSAERLLLTTGIPVLLIPRAWDGETIGENVVIAWNRSREARRAVNDAVPFFKAASRVTIMTVDDIRSADETEAQPGANLLEHLSRHGARAEIVNIHSEGASVADVILEQVAEHDADLLVIGAYSHPRTAQILFGGVTRSLLSSARLPLLISR
ncbi:universal stress protein [Sphingomonas sp. LY54]|uniref:universal stress protein n=1 Tax=Sphingomonas sp. LY54 TaxID=3095343 RepID=UPI002D7654FF|nr:universal stress protein [Sphingomonas sp. LY54]WRP28404.1 universal stress protein [Sphingomonas sp. LY54]